MVKILMLKLKEIYYVRWRFELLRDLYRVSYEEKFWNAISELFLYRYDTNFYYGRWKRLWFQEVGI